MSDIKAVPVDGFNGSPLIPTGNPMIDGVGAAAWADRADEPDRTFHGAPKIVPMRLDPTFSVAKGDPDPRGLPVEAVDKVVAGTVIELWVDRAEPQVRYYEVQLSGTERRIMLPAGFVQWPNFGLWGNDRLLVKSITAAQFADVPAIRRDDQITLLEEDKVMAYFAGGHLYATADRSEPII
ncbi:photosynthetic reaction center subunit H [Gemmatimonas sp.]|jgi:photosynthetic reaction center H subunit|uniref:photosynthetic reaction center subunit H n=1 Tax=Gemmatimonas sp. TaxID=1962908 RepID=UPI0037C0D73C